jgi:hypothetical protein
MKIRVFAVMALTSEMVLAWSRLRRSGPAVDRLY